MVVPCVATMEATTAVADDDSLGLSVGDAWGISKTLNKEELFEILEEEGNISGDDQEMYDLLVLAVKKADLNMALIFEVTRADKNGYTIAVDGGIYFKLSAEFNDNITPFTDIETPLIVDGYFDVIILLQGAINLDKDLMIKSANFDLDMILDMEIKTNLSLIMLMDYLTIDDSDITPIDDSDTMSLEDIFTDTLNTSKLKIGVSLSYDLYSKGESDISSVYDEEEETTSFTVTMDSKQTITASIFANIDGELAELLIRLINDNEDPEEEGSDFDKYIIDENTIQASMMGCETFFDDFGFVIDVIQSSENDDGTFEYEFYIEEQFLGSVDLSPLELPQFENIKDIVINRDSEFYLEGAEKTDVRNVFSSIKGAYNGAVFGLEFTVTYIVDENETTETVAFNGLIKPPTVIDDGDTTKKFVGWITDEDCEWNPNWGVKGDLTLNATYAQTFTDANDLMDHMRSDPSVPAYGYMKINGVDGLEDAFGSESFQFNGTMIVDIYDADGKFLYSWKIQNDDKALATGTTMKFNIDRDDLSDDDRNILSEGRFSGEGNFLYINFGASGLMPGITTITYNVDGIFDDGTSLQIYYVITDEDGNIIGLEPVRITNVVNGNAVFDIDHCSGYVLSSMITPDAENSYTVYIGIASAAAILLIILAVVFIRRKA